MVSFDISRVGDWLFFQQFSVKRVGIAFKIEFELDAVGDLVGVAGGDVGFDLMDVLEVGWFVYVKGRALYGGVWRRACRQAGIVRRCAVCVYPAQLMTPTVSLDATSTA